MLGDTISRLWGGLVTGAMWGRVIAMHAHADHPCHPRNGASKDAPYGARGIADPTDVQSRAPCRLGIMRRDGAFQAGNAPYGAKRIAIARGPIAVALRLVSDKAGEIIGDAVQDRFRRAGYGDNARFGAIGVSIAAAVVVGVGGGIYGAIRNATGRQLSPPSNRFVRGQFQAVNPNGTHRTYTVFQQPLDWNLKNADGFTNAQLAANGYAPYVLKNGRLEQVELHHSRQTGAGPLFEISSSTHRTANGRGAAALHPHGNSQHPTDPVVRRRFDQDPREYWAWRYENR